MLGRSGRPIIVGPWLTETGFELLYWIPFLAWAKAYGNFDPDQLVVVSRGGAAPWYRHITPHYEDIFSLFTPDEFRTRNEARIHEQQGRQKHIDLASFDREIIERVKQARGLDKRQAAASVADVPPLRRLLAAAGAGDADRGVQRLPSAAELPLGDLARAAARASTWRRSSTATRRCRTRRRTARSIAAAARRPDGARRTSCCSTPAQRFDDHTDFAPVRRDRLHTIEHLMTPETNLAVQTRIIRDARGVRRHLRRLLLSGAASAAPTRWRSTRTRPRSASITSRWPSACSPA